MTTTGVTTAATACAVVGDWHPKEPGADGGEGSHRPREIRRNCHADIRVPQPRQVAEGTVGLACSLQQTLQIRRKPFFKAHTRGGRESRIPCVAKLLG